MSVHSVYLGLLLELIQLHHLEVMESQMYFPFLLEKLRSWILNRRPKKKNQPIYRNTGYVTDTHILKGYKVFDYHIHLWLYHWYTLLNVITKNKLVFWSSVWYLQSYPVYRCNRHEYIEFWYFCLLILFKKSISDTISTITISS